MLVYLKAIFEAEYNHLNLWYFVSFICGIIVYFSLNFNFLFSTIGIILLVLLILSTSKRYNIIIKFIYGIIIAFAIGLLVAKYRTASVHGQTIHKPIITLVGGKIESIKPTIIGGQVVLSEIKIEKINRDLQKVKISMPKKYLQEIRVNDYITLLAKLYKPQNKYITGWL
ncbi:MAG TPA: hypothetical protein LFW14_01750 [Rickettsia endosymbiont of Degeeriella rufa]|nr:hypothetical protein [Rickettsia endosymbiont of Degeeriella rufa]